MRNFSFYFRKGFALTKMSLKGKGVFTKLILGLYLILSFFGKMFLFLRPIFLIADNNLAMMIVEAHDFEVNKLFEGINNKRRYTSLLLSNLYLEGIILIAAVAFVVPFVVWSILPGFSNPTIPPMIFAIVAAVVVFVISIMIVLMYSPIGFVTTKGKNLGAGDILFLSKEGSKGIKGKVFFTNFLNRLFIVLIFGLIFLVIYLFVIFLRDEYGQPFMAVNFIVMLILAGFVFLNIFVLTTFRLSNLVSLYSIYFDSVETKHIVTSTRGAAQESYVPLFTDDKEEE